MRRIDYLGKKPYEVTIFGKPDNWSLKDLSAPCDAARDTERYAAMAGHITRHATRNVYAPHPTFDRNICLPEDLKIQIPISSGVTLHRGCNAEGVAVAHGNRSSVLFSTADCAVVVLTSHEAEKSVITQVGRNSLLNRSLLNVGLQPSPRDSVIFNAYNALGVATQRDITASIYLCAGPGFEHNPKHETYGMQNARMRSFITRVWGEDCFHNWDTGELLVHKVIESQLTHPKYGLGLDLSQIEHDGRDTINDCVDGNYLWWSQSRNPHNRKGSNGVLVYIP